MDKFLSKHKWIVLLIAAVLIVLSGVGIAGAQRLEPIELQPYYILMDGEEQVGLVYALDSGWVLADEDGLEYTCECQGCDNATEVLAYATNIPKDGPTPTNGSVDTPVPPVDTPVPPVDTPVPPVDTPIPPDDSRANCGKGNGPEGADPNENACGKKTGEENDA